MAWRLTVYASPCRLPGNDARLACGCWLSFTARDSDPQGSEERFQLCVIHIWVRHTLRAPSVDIGGAVFPVPLPSIVLAEPKCTQAQDRLDTLGGPKLLGALDSFVELFDRRLGFT